MPDDKSKYYTRQTVNGPYADRKRPDASGPKERYIEGWAKDLKEWTEYSKIHSDDPSITKKKLR